MGYQRGALRKLHHKAGETWVLRYRVTNVDGKRVENNVNVGLVRDFPKENDAWREVDRLGLLVRINEPPDDIAFGLMLLPSTISKPTSGTMLSVRSPLIPYRSWSIMFATISVLVGDKRLPSR